MRNSAGGIVQLAYGDDGLDPLSMEGASAGQPLDLGRLLTVGGSASVMAALQFQCRFDTSPPPKPAETS